MLQPLPSGTRFHHSSAHHPFSRGQFIAGLKTNLFTQAYGQSDCRTPLRTFVEERTFTFYMYRTYLASTVINILAIYSLWTHPLCVNDVVYVSKYAIMPLKGIPFILSPDLLYVLSAAGHGDEIGKHCRGCH